MEINSRPLVSVILTTFNDEKTVKRAVQSIIEQTYKKIEIIIVDDYSDDNTILVLNEFIHDERVKLIKKTNQRKHLAASRNLGIANAKGELITFQDGDDWSYPNRIRNQVRLMKESSIDICCTNIRILHDNKDLFSSYPVFHGDIVKGFERRKGRGTVVGATMMVSSKILKNLNYSEYLRFAQDWDLFLRLYEFGYTFGNTQEPLYVYDRRGTNSTDNKEWGWCNLLIRYNQMLRSINKSEIESTDLFRTRFFQFAMKRPIFFGFYLFLFVKKRI